MKLTVTYTESASIDAAALHADSLAAASFPNHVAQSRVPLWGCSVSKPMVVV
jgi:hypothetical protein